MSKRERELVDSGEVFAVLPDAPQLPPGPYVVLPRAADFRLGPRLPSSSTVGSSPRVHTARHRAPAGVTLLSSAAASWAAERGDELTRPAESAEALQWFEPVGRRPCLDTATIRGGSIDLGTSLEIARADLPGWRLAVVERVATYVRVQALTTGGQPSGSPFVTLGDGGYDPFVELLHPVTSEPLGLTWSLVGVARTRPSFDGAPLVGVGGEPVQIQPQWNDLRWGWGQRYTVGLQLEIPTGVTSVRLVATIATSSSSRWRVCVGGRLGGWWIGGGPRGAALAAAISRVGGTAAQ